MTRREFPAKVKATAFELAGGRCEHCTRKLGPGDVHYDHRTPDANGGEPVLNNCSVLCRSCHGSKTAHRDIPAIAKGKRIRQKHIGARRPSSFRGWRKFDGQIVWARNKR